MTNSVYFMDLLNDIREFSEENDFPGAQDLIAKASAAIKEDVTPK